MRRTSSSVATSESRVCGDRPLSSVRRDRRSVTDDVDGWAAIGELYHRYLTGLLLALVTRQGTDRAAEVVFRTFRRQHLELFLPGPAQARARPAAACRGVRAVPRAVQRARRA